MAGRRTLVWFLLKLLVGFSTPTLAQAADSGIFQYIDPLIGTINGGHVFPGATLPFGMAKAVADVNSDERQGGYASDDGES
jgi:putative alpha-1,2-mannosidase